MKLPPHGPEPCASANSAISPYRKALALSDEDILSHSRKSVKYFLRNPDNFFRNIMPAAVRPMNKPFSGLIRPLLQAFPADKEPPALTEPAVYDNIVMLFYALNRDSIPPI